MRIQMTTLLLAAACTAAPLRAQQDTRAADALAAARRAIGGPRLDQLQRFSLEGALQRNVGQMQLSGDVELLIELPDKYSRTETITNGMGGGSKTGFNGDQPLTPARGGIGGGGAIVFRMGPGGPAPGSSDKLSPEEQEKADRTAVRVSRTELSRMTLGWFAMALPQMHATYSYAGEAESPDGKAHVIDVRNDEGFAARLFIDETSGLPLMVSYEGPQPRTLQMSSGQAHSPADIQKQIEEMQKQPPVMTEYRVYFEDWQDADGIKFPFKIRRAMGGTTIEEWSVGRVKVNPKIDAKKFAVER